MSDFTEEGFSLFYEERLKPFEAEWSRLRRKYRLYSGVFTAVGLLFMIAAIGVVVGGNVDFLMVASVTVLFGFGFLYGRRVFRSFRKVYKESCVRPVADLFGLSYFPTGCIPSSEFDHALLFPGEAYDCYSGEDYFEGKQGDTDIRFSEITVTRKGEDSDTIVFNGLLVSADFHKHFNSRTWVIPGSAKSLMGRFGQVLQALGPFGSGMAVKMENAEFERLFTVYSHDKIEARYILSPLLLERLVELRKRNNLPVRVSFVGSRVYLALSRETDLFEASFWSDSDLRAAARFLCHEILFALSIIDVLNLNVRIWTKE